VLSVPERCLRGRKGYQYNIKVINIIYGLKEKIFEDSIFDDVEIEDEC
jgi:hypothetical protein